MREVRSDMEARGHTAEAHIKSTELRSHARRDAVTAVSRARERGGAQRTNWTTLDADTVHAITDLLLNVQDQRGPIDNALADRA